jgi:AraC-like DNA-binding protein
MRTGSRIAHRFLAALLTLFSLGLVDGFMSVTYYYLRYPSLIGVYWPLHFAYGPLVYLYAKSLTAPQWNMQRWKVTVHFLPIILYALYLIPFYLLDTDMKSRMWYVGHSRFRTYNTNGNPILLIGLIQLHTYVLLALSLLKAHRIHIRQIFSSLENINLSWLRNFIFVCIFLAWAHTLFAAVSNFFGFYKEAAYLNHLSVVVVIYVLGYKGIRQPEIFIATDAPGGGESIPPSHPDDRYSETILPDKQPKGPDTDQMGKYKKSALTSVQAEEILTRLVTVMEHDKPYLEMGLTLPMLADKLGIYHHHLSQVINENLDKSFFDFVNEYRVQETKKVLADPGSERFSILGIAMDAGFNSKSAFYTAFKKYTGMTPSQFKEQVNVAGPSSF